MKLTRILKEVESNRDREMVTGVADILKRVKDEQNRRELADHMMKQFDRERVKYDEEEFLKLAKVKKDLKELFDTQANPKKDFDLVHSDSSMAEYKFTLGDLKYVVWIEKYRYYDPNTVDFEVSFGVHNPDKEPENVFDPGLDTDVEVNDMKTVFKTMARVVGIIQAESKREKKEGFKMNRIVFSPTKRKINDPSGKLVTDPNDKRRENLYMAYLKKYLPNAEVTQDTNNPGTLVATLREVGEATSAPFPLKRLSSDRYGATYSFDVKRENGTTDEYRIRITHDDEEGRWNTTTEVSFGVYKPGEKTTDTSGEYKDPKNMYRIMATVVAATKEQVDAVNRGLGEVRRIQFKPVKREETDTRRANLYSAYVRKQFCTRNPETGKEECKAEVTTDPETSTTTVNIPSSIVRIKNQTPIKRPRPKPYWM